MLAINIPSSDRLEIHHVVSDYNGTLAQDGILLPHTPELIKALSQKVTFHVITADTFGQARAQLAGLPVQLTVLPPGNQAEAKRAYIQALGAKNTAALGNGRNDREMLAEAVLGICLLQGEGAHIQTLTAADLICTNIHDALALLLHPQRLAASLRT